MEKIPSPWAEFAYRSNAFKLCLQTNPLVDKALAAPAIGECKD